MKHLVLLVVLLLAGYFSWAYATKRTKSTTTGFLKRHALIVFLIAFAIWAALFASRHGGSINIL